MCSNKLTRTRTWAHLNTHRDTVIKEKWKLNNHMTQLNHYWIYIWMILSQQYWNVLCSHVYVCTTQNQKMSTDVQNETLRSDKKKWNTDKFKKTNLIRNLKWIKSVSEKRITCFLLCRNVKLRVCKHMWACVYKSCMHRYKSQNLKKDETSGKRRVTKYM